mgnify:CR=1 FL=1
MTRLVYILGYGRSGSTFLSLLLGNHKDIQAVGELSCFTNRSQAGAFRWKGYLPCSCLGDTWLHEDSGPNRNKCAFWNEVQSLSTKSNPPNYLESYPLLQHKFERYRNFAHLLMNRISHSTEYTRYADITTTLLKSILEVSKKAIIVDSSKNPIRAYALTMIPNLDLRIIHMVRDGRGVAWSQKSRYRRKVWVRGNISAKPVFKTALHWTVANLLSESVKSQLHPSKSTIVRYEDLVSNPHVELKKIGDLMEIDLSSLSDMLSHNKNIKLGHSVAGNRLRMRNEIRMNPDTEWIGKLSTPEKHGFWLLSGWLMRRYGYTK